MAKSKQIEALRLIVQGKVLPTLIEEAPGEWFARWREVEPEGEENPWIDKVMREVATTPSTKNAERELYASLHDAWLAALSSESGKVNWEHGECAEFAQILKNWSAAAKIDYTARGATVFEFQSKEDGSFAISTSLPKGIAQYRALGEATKIFSPLKYLRRDGERLSVELDMQNAQVFLRTSARNLVKGGWKVEGCAIQADISADMDIGEEDESKEETNEKGEKVKLQIRVAGEAVSAEEIRFLLEQHSTTVFFRNRWIEVDINILKEALRVLEKVNGTRVKPSLAFSFALGVGAMGRLELNEIRAHGWLRGLLNELRAKGEFTSGDFRNLIASIQKGSRYFNGILRKYQSRGVGWISFLLDHHFGALLADDMGLGKTIQTIAWLCREKEKRGGKTVPNLIIAPLTLLANWKHEITSFAPSFKVYLHHGEKRILSERLFNDKALESDVVLTSYHLLVQEYSYFSRIEWASMTIDEAQAIKNSDTRVAHAVKALGAPRRLALTGTPIENSALDVWSIEDFLNPSLLPAKKDFIERFARPIAHDPLGKTAKRLQHALEPFVLRRLKSDKDVASELGEKKYIRQYCELSPMQRAEYERALEDWRQGERTRGDIFALLTRLKLVTDGFLDGTQIEGGKLLRLFDLLESIFAAGESALIFTQYAKVGFALQKALEEKFARAFPYLHGALSAKAREEQIEKFNQSGASAFILSLKAGGFGLNLVKANHVIHFDRWWNPAVEAQATDRAHRIGQKADVVFVHLFITTGTLEERVDDILEHKLTEADSLVKSGESFLASMSSEEFENTIRLAGER